MKTWFTSDQHFHHENIIRYCNRPFVSVNQMNRMMIELYNELVDRDDLVYMLGDFSFGDHGKIKETALELNGRKILVVGNHDTRNLPFYRKSGIFEQVIQGSVVLPIDGEEVRLCHYPYTDDRSAPRNTGEVLLHGHVHGAWKRRWNPSMINVGVDVWGFRPVTLEQLGRAR